MDLKRLFAKGMRVILQPPALTNCILNKNVKICAGSNITNAKIGKYTYFGFDCFVVDANIGSFCSIADGCRIGGAEHLMNSVSTSPIFTAGSNIFHKNFAKFPAHVGRTTNIGSDVWIGASVCIKSGVSIGDGAVIGMGSVVVNDVGPFEIWAGNPAKLIRKRFADETISSLLAISWWNFDDKRIKQLASLFDQPTRLIEHLNMEKQE